MNILSINTIYLLITLSAVTVLNSFKSIVYCSLVFSIISYTVNCYALNTSIKQTMKWLAFIALTSVCLNGKLNYATIHSLSSLFIALSLGVILSQIINHLANNKFNSHTFLLSMILSAVIDSVFVGLALLDLYSLKKALNVVIYDTLYKISYSAFLYLIIYQLTYVKDLFINLNKEYDIIEVK